MYDRLNLWGMRIKEPFSAISHGLGAIASLAIFGLAWDLVLAKGSAAVLIAYLIFGTGTVLVFVASTLYHALPLALRWERRVRKIDQCAVYLMIAGTYTPVCLLSFRDSGGYTLLILIWSLATIGIMSHWKWWGVARRRPHLDAGIFLLMGWLCVLFAYPMIKSLSTESLFWLVSGGILYTIGALSYAVKWPNPVPRIVQSHEIFHLFVLGGAACHIYLMLGPLLASVPVVGS